MYGQHKLTCDHDLCTDYLARIPHQSSTILNQDAWAKTLARKQIQSAAATRTALIKRGIVTLEMI